MEEKEIGKITHYFGHLQVGIIELTGGDLKLGDTIAVRGHTTDFEQKVESMQVEHRDVESAVKGETVGIKVAEKVRPLDAVYKITE